MSPEDYIMETFKLPPELAGRLRSVCYRYDITKSFFIREAITHRLADLETLESVVREAVKSDMIKDSGKIK